MKLPLTILLFLQLSIQAQEIRKMKIDDLENYINSRIEPAVINFWATWCVPCIEEMPWFNKLLGHRKDVELIFVSVDNEKAFPEKIREMINRQKIRSTLIWLDETNADVFCPRIDKNWSGSIPATLMVNYKRKYRKFIEAQISSSGLRKELRFLLKK